jgi:hypothetical protein
MEKAFETNTGAWQCSVQCEYGRRSASECDAALLLNIAPRHVGVWGIQILLHVFLALVLVEGEQSTSQSCRFTPRSACNQTPITRLSSSKPSQSLYELRYGGKECHKLNYLYVKLSP